MKSKQAMSILLLFLLLVSGCGVPSVVPRPLLYYGANLERMETTTGVNAKDNTVKPGAPGVQEYEDKDYLATVCTLINYGSEQIRTQDVLNHDMNNLMVPPGGPLKARDSDASQANISLDYGADPRAQNYAVDFELGEKLYHQHLYTDPTEATLGMIKALDIYRKPIIAFVNHGLHAVVIVGFFTTKPLKKDISLGDVESLLIFNPWNLKFGLGPYLSNNYYATVSIRDWLTSVHLPDPFARRSGTSWFAQPYSSNGRLDPDPILGPYQAGKGTEHPLAQHWLGKYVVIQPDDHQTTDADIAYDEYGRAMQQP